MGLAALIMALGGTMIGTGHHSPQLGIDLAGGTTMTMTAKGGTPSAADMDTALQIMRNRVNGQGVSEAEVTKQGNKAIQVDLPGKNSSDLLKQLGQTAELTFRVVVPDPSIYGAKRPPNSPTPVTPTTPSSAPSASPSGTPSSSPSGTPSKAPSSAPSTPKATPSATSTQHRVADAGLQAAAPSATPSGGSTGSGTPSASPSSGSTASPSKPAGSATPSAPSSSPTTPSTASNGAPKQPTPESQTIQLYDSIDCNHPPSDLGQQKPENFAVGCDYQGKYPYLLAPADVNGRDLKANGAAARQEQTGGQNSILTGNWEVDLSFNSKGAKEFGDVTTQLYSNGGRFAVDLDGVVYSAPTVQSPIVDGNARITGSFSQKDAENLANVLKFGALPISFDQGDVSQISASLAGNQLTGGLVAGGIGMVLVIAYLIMYYRGLAVVAVSSLAISAILTYSIATLLGPAMGFRLSLAGVAGLVVAIGITADSFVIFFERLRDEVREGRSLRTAVDHGWVRARRTIISSDFVSFLAAAVLYEVSVGTVRGFAFTLGLTTLLDLLVVFTFTKPVMTLLARRRFFSTGHPWSGLDPSRLGAKKSPGLRQTIVDRRRAQGSAEGMEA